MSSMTQTVLMQSNRLLSRSVEPADNKIIAPRQSDGYMKALATCLQVNTERFATYYLALYSMAYTCASTTEKLLVQRYMICW